MSDRDSAAGADGADGADGAEGRAPAPFCPEGCYWECEHLVARGEVSAERAALRRVEHDDASGVTLMRCQDCGDFLYDVVGHAREHERLRQLGWLSEESRNH